MNVDLAAGVWRLHQVPESLLSYDHFTMPHETGGSTTVLFDLTRRSQPVPDARFGAQGDWFDARWQAPDGWAHSDAGAWWVQAFGPPKGSRGGWMLQMVQTKFGPPKTRTSDDLTLWVGALTEHPDWGFARVRFFGHGRRNTGRINPDDGSGGRLSFTLTQQLASDPRGAVFDDEKAWLDWRANRG